MLGPSSLVGRRLSYSLIGCPKGVFIPRVLLAMVLGVVILLLAQGSSFPGTFGGAWICLTIVLNLGCCVEDYLV